MSRASGLSWRSSFCLGIGFALLSNPMALHAQEDTTQKFFEPFGDIRIRAEQDWDGRNGDGTAPDDRLRLRYRLRAGFVLNLSERWSTAVQVRSGPKDSQQSPHNTFYDFDGGAEGPHQFSFDTWSLNYETPAFQAWAGRDVLSFWHQDAWLIIDNVTYAGIGGTWRREIGNNEIVAHANYVKLPVGMRDFSGEAFIGQLVYDIENDGHGFTLAAALHSIRADPDDPVGQELLLTENNTRDYDVLQLQFQYRRMAFGRPLTLGVDLTHNFKNYDNAPEGSFSQIHRDNVNGYVLEALWGKNEVAGDWRVGYYYANQEALSANSSYIQDEWARWGNAVQARLTNLKGSEFRFLYTINERQGLVARLFLVDAIDLLYPGDTALEAGKRLRIDYNFAF